MSNFQGLLNAVGHGGAGQSSTATEQQIRQQNAAMQNASGIYNSVGALGGGYFTQASVAVQPAVYEIPNGGIVKDPNKNAAMTMPLSALVDLWRVKFGDTWLYAHGTLHSVEDFDLWKMAAVRLYANNKFEVVAEHFRLREDA